MKRIFSLILVMMSIAFQSMAQESTSGTSTKTVGFEAHKKDNNASPTIHRAPMRINVEAYYNVESGVLDICYDGEATGVVFLYLNGNVIGYDSEINTSFQISAPGLYKIEIDSESWTAEGYLKL